MKITIEANSIDELRLILSELTNTRKSIPIETLFFQYQRTRNILIQEGIDCVEVLCKKTPMDILKTPNSGQKTLEDIRQALAKKGLFLLGDSTSP